MSRYSALALLTFVLGACTPTAPELDLATHAVVYGADDREDVYAHPNIELRALTEASIAAMISHGTIDTSDPNDVQLYAGTLGDAYGLCSGERFADQPTAASCSGTLIDDNLVLTAGHCVTSQADCTGVAFVFNYYMASQGTLARITSDDVYACSELVVQYEDGATDYAIVRLDRPVVGHSPAPVNPSTQPVSQGDDVTIIGFGSGLPAKIDDGGHVIDARLASRDYFQATTDAFGGNSGSGVFDAAGRVIGILVRGDQDYVDGGGCARVNTVPADGSTGGEDITYAFRAVEALCASGYPSARLCQTEVVCGDGVCSGGESSASCPTDCEASTPGVNPGTDPTGWSCDPSYYGTGDGCDCECGAYDPDCDDPGQQLYGCDAGQVCDAAGRCAGADTVVDPSWPSEPETGEVPASWTCEPGFYGTLDGCDCECGAYDPDCDDPGQQVFGCQADETCHMDGVCGPTGGINPDNPEPTWPEDPAAPEPTDDVGGGTDAGPSDGEHDPIRDALEECSQAPRGSAPVWALWFIGLVVWRRRPSDQ